MITDLACWPMYNQPSVAPAWDALWALTRDALRAQGLPAPDSLCRDLAPMDSWAAPNLLIGQICNQPYRRLYRGQPAGVGLHVLGCLDHDIAGCPAGHYRSVLVVAEGDPAQNPADCDGYRLAYNEALSHSGWGTTWDWAGRHGITLRPELQTGAHVQSLDALRQGQAQIASIDALSWRFAPAEARAGLRVLDHSIPRPGMSYITRAADPAPVRAALSHAVETLGKSHRAALALRGFVTLPDLAYDFALPPSPQEALTKGA